MADNIAAAIVSCVCTVVVHTVDLLCVFWIILAGSPTTSGLFFLDVFGWIYCMFALNINVGSV